MLTSCETVTIRSASPSTRERSRRIRPSAAWVETFAGSLDARVVGTPRYGDPHRALEISRERLRVELDDHVREQVTDPDATRSRAALPPGR